MPSIQQNVSLLPYNTFRVDCRAKFFVAVTTERELRDVLQSDLFKRNPHLILGGGSNVLFTQDFEGLTIRNELPGIDVVADDGILVKLRAGAGESWHRLVTYAVDRDFGGIENLSLIPGTVGAAPMQNIGAYGVEIADTIDKVEAIDLSTGELREFTRAECRFGYRESVFKQELKNRFLISSITLTLTKKDHRLNTSYGAIAEVLEDKKVRKVTVRAISEAVIDIRKKKLPDPDLIGNAGSFFKNPSVESSVYDSLKNKFPAMPSFAGENNLIKIPAGWMIEQCGWKGKTLENIGVHRHQALVLVNYGGGEGIKILQLANQIQESVREKFGVILQPEVNII